MRKRWFWVISIAVVLAVGVLAVATREREPEYGGKKLSEWVERYAPRPGTDANRARTEEAAEAIRQIGTNALPCLLKWMFYETPPWKRKFYGAVNRIIRPFDSVWQLTDKKDQSINYYGYAGFIALGPTGRSAIPDLLRVGKNPTHIGASYAAGVVEWLGNDAVPELVAVLRRQDRFLRLSAIAQLTTMGTNGRAAVPALRRVLTDPEWDIRDAATNALRAIDFETLENATTR